MHGLIILRKRKVIADGLRTVSEEFVFGYKGLFG